MHASGRAGRTVVALPGRSSQTPSIPFPERMMQSVRIADAADGEQGIDGPNAPVCLALRAPAICCLRRGDVIWSPDIFLGVRKDQP